MLVLIWIIFLWPIPGSPTKVSFSLKQVWSKSNPVSAKAMITPSPLNSSKSELFCEASSTVIAGEALYIGAIINKTTTWIYSRTKQAYETL